MMSMVPSFLRRNLMTDLNNPPSNTLVMKFGGTSVGTPEAMGQTVEIVRQAQVDWPRLVVVTSALSGVTNLLLDSASRAARGENGRMLSPAEDQLRATHRAMIEALVGTLDRRRRVRQEVDGLIGDFVNLCQAIGILGEATPRALDTV